MRGKGFNLFPTHLTIQASTHFSSVVVAPAMGVNKKIRFRRRRTLTLRAQINADSYKKTICENLNKSL